MSDEYKPISCDQHSQYELWIMRRQQIKLAWHEDDITRIARVMPVDVRADNGVEYLYFETGDASGDRVRLDHIVEAEPIGNADHN